MVDARTDDVDADGAVDGALLAGRDARVQAGVAPLDPLEHQHASAVVAHAARQPSPAAHAAHAAVPAHHGRHAAVGDAGDARDGAKLELNVVGHRPELEPLCTTTR